MGIVKPFDDFSSFRPVIHSINSDPVDSGPKQQTSKQTSEKTVCQVLFMTVVGSNQFLIMVFLAAAEAAHIIFHTLDIAVPHVFLTLPVT